MTESIPLKDRSASSATAADNFPLVAHRITARDSVLETQDGARLPGGPLLESHAHTSSPAPDSPTREKTAAAAAAGAGDSNIASAPAYSDPLFPPLPVYGPPTPLRSVQIFVFRLFSGVCSACFLLVIVFGALFTELVPMEIKRVWERINGRDPDRDRPFYEEEKIMERARRGDPDAEVALRPPGKLPLRDDIGFYARAVGLEMEMKIVETADGFLLEMQHIYNPSDPPAYMVEEKSGSPRKRKYPVLLVHGLLQSAGAYCVNDERSLAFYLCKSGYDVFLANNRCGVHPRHTTLHPSDPRMWAWTTREMGILDLPAFLDTIITLTSFPKVGLVAHSQGTTLTFVALAKQQLPSLGDKISIFCALAPAVYAGPLIDRAYFKFMRIVSPRGFRLVFGIHSFIPFMLFMQKYTPRKLYGSLGYRVFAFLFSWSDTRWDRGLRDRFFQFAPVYVSAETMRWWLGRECFAKYRCILGPEDDGPWFDERFPKLALWVAGQDQLVDGKRLLQRLEEKESKVRVVHKKVLETYEHLDVVWAMDAVEEIFSEMRTLIWKELDPELKEGVVVPEGCE